MSKAYAALLATAVALAAFLGGALSPSRALNFCGIDPRYDTPGERRQVCDCNIWPCVVKRT